MTCILSKVGHRRRHFTCKGEVVVAGQEDMLLLGVPFIQEDEPVDNPPDLRPPVIVVAKEDDSGGAECWSQRLL